MSAEKLQKIVSVGNFGVENVQIGEKKDSFPGGSGFRFVLIASMFIPTLKVYSIVGKEPIWDQALKALIKNGVDISGIQRTKKSIQFFTKYDQGLELQDFRIENAEIMSQIAYMEIDSGLNRNSILHINPLDFDSQAKLVRRGKSQNSTISMQMHYSSITPENGEKYLGLFSQVDMLFMTEEEAKLLTQKESLIESAKQTSEHTYGYIFITKGKKGVSVYQSSKEVLDLPAIEVENPANLEGAGDAFAAGVISGLSLNYDIEKATRLGLIAANFSVQFSSTNEMIVFINKSK